VRVAVFTSKSFLSGKYRNTLLRIAETHEVSVILKAGWDSSDVYKKKTDFGKK